MRYRSRIDELVLWSYQLWSANNVGAVLKPTGTFFCDSTTAQSLPRTPTDMMLAAVMALKAYSIQAVSSVDGHRCETTGHDRSWFRSTARTRREKRTDLIQAAIVGEDGDVTIVGTGCKD